MKVFFLRSGGIAFWITCTFWMMSFTPIRNEKVISDFKLRNVDGKNFSLADYPDAKGFIIVFSCNHCPFAKLYPSRMNDLNAKYRILGVPLLAISSTDTSVYEDDGYEQMVKRSRTEKFNFPYLYDPEQIAAKNFGAKNTPHAFVVWKENEAWVVKYNGAIDDNGAEPERATHHYVADAVDSLLSGKEVYVCVTTSIGCRIYIRK